LPLAGWLEIKHVWPSAEMAANALSAAIGLRGSVVTAFAMPLGMLIYAVTVVGWYSRLLEHDADLDACLNDEGQIDAVLAADFCSALVTLCGRSRESWLSRWLHPPLFERIRFVRRVISTASVAPAFRRKLALIAISIGLLFAAAASMTILL
jgi:hypothetical protein